MLNKIDFIVKTFKRYDCLEALLQSLYKFYPEANVIIADDNSDDDFRGKFYRKWPQAKLLRLPFDVGLSAGRNRAVEMSEKEFILLLDDDFVFTEKTDIEKFFKVIQSDERIGVVGGLCIENDRDIHYEHLIHLQGTELRQLPDGDNYIRIDGVKAKETECVLNFALFRKEVFKKIKWDDSLKLAEHLDFYLRFKKTRWKVFYTPEVKIIHLKKRDENYIRWRLRGRKYSIQMFRKHGITKLITINGGVTELKHGELVNYKIR